MAAFEAAINQGTGEMVAVNQDTGKVEWDDKLPSSPYGAAAVTNDVVFTTTFHGDLYAFDAATGAVLRTIPLSFRTNTPVTIDGDYLITAASVLSSVKQTRADHRLQTGQYRPPPPPGHRPASRLTARLTAQPLTPT